MSATCAGARGWFLPDRGLSAWQRPTTSSLSTRHVPPRGRCGDSRAGLPWNRPVDGVATIVDGEAIPAETLVRTASFARATGMRLALHFVLSTPSRAAAWRVVESDSRSGQALCTQLAQDTARIWLGGGARQGLEALSRAQAQHLPAAIDRALAAAPSTSIDIASLCFGGAGLRGAVAQTTGRTRPAAAPGISMWIGAGVLAAGAGLATLVTVTGIERAGALRAVVDSAQREANTSWLADGFDTVPSTSRVYRMAGLGTRLARYSELSATRPAGNRGLGLLGPTQTRGLDARHLRDEDRLPPD